MRAPGRPACGPRVRAEREALGWSHADRGERLGKHLGIRHADPVRAGRALSELGLRLTYYPDRQVVQPTVSPQRGNVGKWLVSEGGARP
jgi:hypothetical protein